MLSLLFAVVAALSVVQGLTLDTPSDWTSPGNLSLSWSTSAGDPPAFNVFLVNTQADVLNGAFAVLSAVPADLGETVFALGVVNTDPQYRLRATAVEGNASAPLAESGPFSIARLPEGGSSGRTLPAPPGASTSASVSRSPSRSPAAPSSTSSSRADPTPTPDSAAPANGADAQTPSAAGERALGELELMGWLALLLAGVGAVWL